ncbi:hypothetical protein PV08_03171 [Exophiala spinifera]|uniref:Cytochrome b5 heme-binding domain-containing protein n=1 Tax=Exophiala spinifera TaxID=91928 RepID=A0A0D2A1Q6_9EURO|nr:uncharacterized protein PV08_03171 [Exophiala spinifera]KIW18882.1 hypothetical protein PV08_03171 [Exophiala spinifera]
MNTSTPSTSLSDRSFNTEPNNDAAMMLAHTLPRHHYETPARFNSEDDAAAVQPTEPVEQIVFTHDELTKYDGTDDSKPILVAIKGTVFDVSRNTAYRPGGAYHVYAGKDPSRALALSSRDPEDCVPEWYDLEYKYRTVLDEWHTYFQKRYKVVGSVKSGVFALEVPPS